MSHFDPSRSHDSILQDFAPELSYSRNSSRPIEAWRDLVRARFRDLYELQAERVPLKVRIEYEREEESWYETRFVFTAERECDVPCHLVIPKTGRPPYPLVIGLQGHNSGMHITLGRIKSEADRKGIDGQRDVAVQAVARGYAGLALEQRAFGERQGPRQKRGYCNHLALTAMMLGRSTVGERAWDISRAIDAMESFSDKVDLSRIACTGNSGGGKTSYYAACLDQRITVSMPSCSVCSLARSAAVKEICACAYLPGALRYFDMADFAVMIAPRPLIVVSGEHDELFDVDTVREDFKVIQEIYRRMGAPDGCRHVIGPEGHRFYADLAWPVFQQVTGW